MTLALHLQSLGALCGNNAGGANDVPLVVGDIGLIERVRDNLVDIALRCTPRGGKIDISLAPADDHVVVRVVDAGTRVSFRLPAHR